MTETLGWLSLLTIWITFLWIGGAIGEYLIPMLQRSRVDDIGKVNNRETIGK